MDDGTALVELRCKNGPSLWAVIDADDAPLAAAHRWRADARRHTTYARTKAKVGDRRVGLFLHRLIMAAPAGVMVDHIDHNGLNNRRSNLRLATAGQNQANQRPVRLGSSSHKGVTWLTRKKGWQAAIQAHDGRNIYLGRYDREQDAALAYDLAAIDIFGEFAFTNFPRELIGQMPAPQRHARAELPHGRARYAKHKCRCDVCKAAESQYQRVRRERRAAA